LAQELIGNALPRDDIDFLVAQIDLPIDRAPAFIDPAVTGAHREAAS
jgi:hypothetical protein